MRQELLKEKEENKNRKIDFGDEDSDETDEEERLYYQQINQKISEKEAEVEEEKVGDGGQP